MLFAASLAVFGVMAAEFHFVEWNGTVRPNVYPVTRACLAAVAGPPAISISGRAPGIVLKPLARHAVHQRHTETGHGEGSAATGTGTGLSPSGGGHPLA